MSRRTSGKRADQLREIGRLDRQGMCSEAIAEKVGISGPTVRRDLEEIRAARRAFARMAPAEALERILSNIEWARAEAEAAYERSKVPLDAKGKPITDENNVPITLPGESKYLNVALQATDRETKLRGLEAPDKLELSGKDGGPIEHVDVTDAELEAIRRAFRDRHSEDGGQA